ncbi:hypothetical protein Lalb_Chr02g0154531 [Lupinus albus]|uniref:Uncharacterized protein n=1 Tax=Lupinus albus TaxID=3870 RepID=A0A6A4R0C3_LUPAL|nr:hypothetical protein Lalb_Chr02g0154531 [Lupinus albus]
MNPLCEDRENRHCQLRPFRITILGDDSKGTKMGSSENPGLSEVLQLCMMDQIP